MVYLQQDAFDPIDVSTDIKRQKESLELLIRIINSTWSFNSKDEIRKWFNRMTDSYRNMNYAAFKSDSYHEHLEQIDKLLIEGASSKPEPAS